MLPYHVGKRCQLGRKLRDTKRPGLGFWPLDQAKRFLGVGSKTWLFKKADCFMPYHEGYCYVFVTTFYGSPKYELGRVISKEDGEALLASGEYEELKDDILFGKNAVSQAAYDASMAIQSAMSASGYDQRYANNYGGGGKVSMPEDQVWPNWKAATSAMEASLSASGYEAPSQYNVEKPIWVPEIGREVYQRPLPARNYTATYVGSPARLDSPDLTPMEYQSLQQRMSRGEQLSPIANQLVNYYKAYVIKGQRTYDDGGGSGGGFLAKIQSIFGGRS